MEPLLITKEDFKPYRNLSIKVDNSQLEPYIIEAQRMDLPGYLGRDLTARLIHNYSLYLANKDAYVATELQPDYLPTETEQDWLWLIEGRKYILNDINYGFGGIKAVLVYLTYSRYVRESHIQSTQSGFKMNTNQYSEHISIRDINELATRAENDAQFLMGEVREYLKQFNFWEVSNVCCDTTRTKDPRRLKLGAIKGNRFNCNNRCR